jgi:ribose 5-phosphate isomerase A
MSNLKKRAAAQALTCVQDGMLLGLGSGSTTTFFIEMLGHALQTGELQGIQGVPTSEKTARLAREQGIPLVSLEQYTQLDLAIDGADEVDPDLNLIKGLGHALLREKIIAVHANRFVTIVDQSKRCYQLGTLGPLPIEIAPFAAAAHVRWLRSLGCRAELWLGKNGHPILTDNGHYLARCWFSNGIDDPHKLADRLSRRPGILEHGLFLDMTDEVIVATDQETHVITKNTL